MTSDLNKKNQWVNSQNRSIEGNKRIPWDQYFMAQAVLLSLRSTCSRLEVGATLVKDRLLPAATMAQLVETFIVLMKAAMWLTDIVSARSMQK